MMRSLCSRVGLVPPSGTPATAAEEASSGLWRMDLESPRVAGRPRHGRRLGKNRIATTGMVAGGGDRHFAKYHIITTYNN
jgi:hypothetical protein